MDPRVRAQSATNVTLGRFPPSDLPVSPSIQWNRVAPPHRLFEDQMYSSLRAPHESCSVRFMRGPPPGYSGGLCPLEAALVVSRGAAALPPHPRLSLAPVPPSIPAPLLLLAT